MSVTPVRVSAPPERTLSPNPRDPGGVDVPGPLLGGRAVDHRPAQDISPSEALRRAAGRLRLDGHRDRDIARAGGPFDPAGGTDLGLHGFRLGETSDEALERLVARRSLATPSAVRPLVVLVVDRLVIGPDDTGSRLGAQR